MQFYPLYEQKNPEAISTFVQSQPSCRLVTTSPEGVIHLGVFNHHYDNGSFFLHLNRQDEQIADLKANSRALIVIEEFFSLIPSYWVDEKDASFATAYYRYAEFVGEAEVSDTRESLVRVLQNLMNHYQPEKQYADLNPDSTLYRRSLGSLAVVQLKPKKVRTKWKLGQNRPVARRMKIIQNLRDRGMPSDLRAAEEMEAWIQAAT